MIRTSERYRIGVVIALVIMSTNCFGQTRSLSGFYINITNKKNCTNLIPELVGREEYCISENPIINAGEFESITRIHIDPLTNEQTMNLKLSPKGLKTWEGVVKNLPEAVILLVIDGQVVGIFKNEGYRKSNIIPIYAPAGSSQLQWIHDHLKKVMIVN